MTSRSLNAGGPPPSASSPRVDNTGSNPAISAPFLNTGSQPILSSTGSNPGISATLLNTGSNPAISAPSLITGGMPPISMPGSSPGSGPLSFGSLEPMEKGPKDPNIGRVFGGKYLIERVLGEGGMGVVYLAKHKAIGKRFAIKLLHPDAIKDHEVVERFKVEAEAASSIGNEHIIDITDFAELEDGSTYFVMEMLDGKPLSKLFEELKRVPTPRLVRIVKQLAQGLGAAHVAGIVHRDLKPDNIYLCKRSGGELDFVKILDFGIAKVGQSTNKLTKAGAIFGTPHYMSPEQASGSPIDHRTDIYALGVILYEGSVGRVPFDADNFMGILTQHMYKAPVPPRAVPECPADLPAGLEVIIMRCLRKKPEERYETMEELEADLDRLARGEVPKAAQDMMALSAGYQSLAQSAIAAHGMPKPIPGEPPTGSPKKGSWPLYAGIAGVLAVVSIATIALIGPKNNANAGGTAETSAPTPASKPIDSAAASATTSAAGVATSATAPLADAPKSRMVLVMSTPEGAMIWDGTKSLGATPKNVDVATGTSKHLVLKMAGFKDEPLDVKDSSGDSVTAKLTSSAVAPAWTVKKPSGGGTDVDDPWAGKH